MKRVTDQPLPNTLSPLWCLIIVAVPPLITQIGQMINNKHARLTLVARLEKLEAGMVQMREQLDRLRFKGKGKQK